RRRVRAPAPLVSRAPGREAAQGRTGREPARRPRRLPPGTPGRGDRDARGGAGARGSDRPDGVLPGGPGGESLLLARNRWRPRLFAQFARDARAGRRHQGARRHHSGGACRVLRAARAGTSRQGRSRHGCIAKTSTTQESDLAELEIRNLHVTAEGKEILKGVSLDVEKSSIHALMGPNGSGKSTLANAIMGHPSLEVTEGTITFKGEDITEADPDERSRMGLFMAFQYPVAIPGV